MGLNWFKRVYVTSTNWENTQDITLQNGDFYSVHGTRALMQQSTILSCTLM